MIEAGFTWIEDKEGNIMKASKITNNNIKGERFQSSNLTSQGASAEGSAPFVFKNETFTLSGNKHWKTNHDGLKTLARADRLFKAGKTLSFKRYANDFPYAPFNNMWTDTIQSTFAIENIYIVQTATKVVERCLLMTTDPGHLVLDPTCGSGTTAYVAEQWGRRWITTDTSRVALALARTRIMSAKYPYYMLADTPDGIIKEAEVSQQFPPTPMPKTEGDIKKGFVYKKVPHITLKSIANNPDIKEGMTREQIDKAIAKHADTETLYDQPYEDNKRIRVSGPFTVESLSPHRILSTDEERPQSEKSPEKSSGHGQFETMILENLKKAGVQNTIKKERLKFDRLESFAGLYIHGEGDYTESGTSKRVAVSIGPEHGTVSSDLVKEAAKEAVKGVGFDLLIVCGFSFDPHANEVAKEFAPAPAKANGKSNKSDDPVVSEEMRQFGKLTVLLARMNPDLAMGDELLKKTGSGNLFMVFGEPDITIKKTKDKMMTVELKGLDVYDPTTGQIRSHSNADIACWFIDTDYNEESFFVRHAYFSGADKPYEKLKRALRAEIDESAWSTLYSTISRPFPFPEKGKIAIKVINHYGDEVLKVYEV
jgi:adenine-specific DNA-methyltransferase